jgi:hypothetical protein
VLPEDYLVLPAATLKFLVRQMLMIAVMMATVLLHLMIHLTHYLFGSAAQPIAQRGREFGVEAAVCIAVLGFEAVLIHRFRKENRRLERQTSVGARPG